jgi:hypothetical protein
MVKTDVSRHQRERRLSVDKLTTLQARCKCGIYLTINEHRDMYQTVEEAFEEHQNRGEPIDVDDDIKQQMIATNTMVRLQCYPDTPIGFYQVWHYAVDGALTEALAIE